MREEISTDTDTGAIQSRAADTAANGKLYTENRCKHRQALRAGLASAYRTTRRSVGQL